MQTPSKSPNTARTPGVLSSAATKSASSAGLAPGGTAPGVQSDASITVVVGTLSGHLDRQTYAGTQPLMDVLLGEVAEHFVRLDPDGLVGVYTWRALITGGI